MQKQFSDIFLFFGTRKVLFQVSGTWKFNTEIDFSTRNFDKIFSFAPILFATRLKCVSEDSKKKIAKTTSPNFFFLRIIGNVYKKLFIKVGAKKMVMLRCWWNIFSTCFRSKKVMKINFVQKKMSSKIYLD